MEKAAAAKSQAVLHHRIRTGVAVGHRNAPSAKQQARMARAAAKADKKRRLAEANEAYHAARAGRKAGHAARGSRRGAAVEAQWGNNAGQYKE